MEEKFGPGIAPEINILTDKEKEQLKRALAPKMARDEKKSRMSLLPMDILKKYVLAAYEEGVIKYERESWRRGFLVSEMIDAAQRHISSFFDEGEDFDPDAYTVNGVMKHHLAGAIFSLISILHTLEYRPELDDRRFPGGGELIVNQDLIDAVSVNGYLEHHKEQLMSQYGPPKQGK